MRPGHYLVVDLEATCCDERRIPAAEMETIEIGAVMIEARGLSRVDEFQTFVRPVRHPRLTAFCMALTSIRQEDVDAAPGFAEALEAFRGWVRRFDDALFCAWGDYDRRQLEQDCALHGVACPVDDTYVNLKRRLAERQGLARRPGLAEALGRARLPFDGRQHRGIDDARNTARLLPFVFGEARLPGRETD